MNQAHGIAIYETLIGVSSHWRTLSVGVPRDIISVWVDGDFIGTVRLCFDVGKVWRALNHPTQHNKTIVGS
jgi:hypothetical protein